MKINTLTMGIIILLLIFGGISTTLAMDLWSTTSDKTPAKIKEGYAAGSYNPADIRGSYTFNEVADAFEIDLGVMFEAFNIPSDTDGNEIKTKDLENLYEGSEAEIGNESVQLFVALYKNLPIELDGTYITKNAAKLILQENSQLTGEQKNYIETHSVDLTIVSQTDEIDSDNISEGTETVERIINGSSTFQNVLDAGVTKEQIEIVINSEMPPTNQTVKNYCIEKGLSFSDIKNKLNEIIE